MIQPIGVSARGELTKLILSIFCCCLIKYKNVRQAPINSNGCCQQVVLYVFCFTLICLFFYPHKVNSLRGLPLSVSEQL